MCLSHLSTGREWRREQQGGMVDRLAQGHIQPGFPVLKIAMQFAELWIGGKADKELGGIAYKRVLKFVTASQGETKKRVLEPFLNKHKAYL